MIGTVFAYRLCFCTVALKVAVWCITVLRRFGDVELKY
jgi:hypothetical protein